MFRFYLFFLRLASVVIITSSHHNRRRRHRHRRRRYRHRRHQYPSSNRKIGASCFNWGFDQVATATSDQTDQD